MPVVAGFEALTGSYLGQDWDLFGKTADDAIVNFVIHRRRHVAAAMKGFEGLLASAMSEQEFCDHWIYRLHSGYDPRDDGYAFREFFAHALDLLRTTASQTTDGD